ncbi:thioredoxin [Methanolobus halotolerans]|uniref:Thioredoxin n=1 Tax=Methanolobus halotolerans TaxID=2052935 RepID=A0A4E0Q6I0_9EURY|nr:thioredoxin [Methanolobus halotolerans]TGC09723.1 thioredoxin [Methanolobus halotolerans]
MDELESIRKKKMEELQRTLQERQFPATVITLNDSDLERYVSQYPLMVVDCWAQWCGPCRTLSPIIDQLAGELQGKVVFGKLNVDENKATAVNFGISSIPSMLVFKQGKLVDRIIGAVPRQRIIEKLQPFM